MPDLVLDIEEFDDWRMHEAERLSGAAICRNAEADGEAARAAAERLIALEPTRGQRTALKLLARYKGRSAAAKYAAALRKAAPDRTELFLKRPLAQDNTINSGQELHIFHGLRLVLATSPAGR